jgi:integrase
MGTQAQTAGNTRGPRRAKGSISKNRVGNWQARYTDPYGQRRVAGTFRRKADAEQALARVLNAIEDNTWSVLDDAISDGVDPKALTLRQASSLYVESRSNSEGRGLSVYTLQEYPRLVKKVLADLADKPVRAIRPRDVERWWSKQRALADERQKAGKKHGATMAQASKAYSHLNSVMSYALKRKWIRENPCDIKGASNYLPAIEPPVPTGPEVALMLQFAAEPMRTIVALAAYCGLRKGDILELRRKDFHSVEQDNGDTWWFVSLTRQVKWEGENTPIVDRPKSRASVRTLAIPKEGGAEEIILERLRSIPQDPETLLVSKDDAGKVHWSKSMLKPRWYKLRALAGYTGTFHSLKKFHLTWYAQKGATDREIMDRGGHTTMRVALRYQRSMGREISLLEK